MHLLHVKVLEKFPKHKNTLPVKCGKLKLSLFVLMHSLQSLRLTSRHLWIFATKNKSQVFGSTEINMVRKSRNKRKNHPAKY